MAFPAKRESGGSPELPRSGKRERTAPQSTGLHPGDWEAAPIRVLCDTSSGVIARRARKSEDLPMGAAHGAPSVCTYEAARVSVGRRRIEVNHQ